MQTESFLYRLFAPPKRVVKAVRASAIRHLTDPVSVLPPSEVTNLQNLKKRVRIGDVLLVAGNARISQVVKVMTLSTWSHVVLYVGDRRDLLRDNEREDWRARYGEQALSHLVVDADPVRGVHLRPVDEYVGLMVRHCRPEGLSPEDRIKVSNMALSQLGLRYDVVHILRLMVFFAFPWRFLPESWRRFITEFALNESETICSRVLSEAFHSVGYPVRPMEIVINRHALRTRALGLAFGLKNRSRTAARLFASGRFGKALSRLTDTRYLEFHLKVGRYITPSDYDLSRFFSVIKDKSDLQVDYRNATSFYEMKY